MSVRICPRCSTLIESRSAIFCYNCGQELARPDAGEALGVSAKGVLPRTSGAEKPSVGINFFLLLVPFLIFILLFSVLYLRTRGNLVSSVLLKPTSNEFVSTISALPVSPVNFGKYNFGSLVPASAELYLESYNPKLFLEKLLDSQDQRDLESKVGLSLDEITSFVEPEFAFVESSSSAALIVVGKDLDFLNSRADKISDPKFKTLSVDSYFIISNSESFLREISLTQAKSVLSLASLAKFQESLKNLPKNGQILLYSSSLERSILALRIYFGHFLDLAVSSLSGTSFVVSADAGNVVIRGLGFN